MQRSKWLLFNEGVRLLFMWCQLRWRMWVCLLHPFRCVCLTVVDRLDLGEARKTTAKCFFSESDWQILLQPLNALHRTPDSRCPTRWNHPCLNIRGHFMYTGSPVCHTDVLLKEMILASPIYLSQFSVIECCVQGVMCPHKNKCTQREKWRHWA